MKRKIATQIVTCSCLLIALLAGKKIYAQNITTFSGNGTAAYSGDGGPASAAGLSTPAFASFDRAGNMYIADRANNCVRKVNAATGIITTIAGNGTPGFSGDNDLAISAELQFPNCVIVDTAGNVFIADVGNNVIRKIDTAGIIHTIAGTPLVHGYAGDHGPATAAELNNPATIAFDAAENIYISDFGNFRIRKINHGDTITTVAGTGAPFPHSDGVAATSSALYFPEQVAFDAAGNMYIAELLGNRIRKVDNAGIISTVVGDGTGSFSGNGGPATAATINSPEGVCFDHMGNMYIADQLNYQIRKIDAAGIITSVAGNDTSGYTGDGGLATAAELVPMTIAFDAFGNMYITDEQSNVIRKVTMCAPGIITNSGPATYCDSGSLDLSLTGTIAVGSPVSYEWLSSADGISYTAAGTGPDYSTGTLTGTIYYKAYINCASSNIPDSTTVDTITVTPVVIPAIAITASPGTSIAAGLPVTFTATVTGGGTSPTYQWLNNGIDISGATNNTYTTSTLNDSDVITCVTYSSSCAGPDTSGSNALAITISGGVNVVNTVSTGQDGIKIYPIPNNGAFDIKATLNNCSSVEIGIFNTMGQMVYHEQTSIQNNILLKHIILPIDNASGIYEIRIKTDKETNTLPFVIER